MKKTFKEIINEPITPQTGCLFAALCMVALVAVIVLGLIFGGRA